MDTYDTVAREFQNPPPEFSPAPFWFLNELLDEGRLRWQMHQMHAQHVRAAVMHPRPGMVTEYLSEEFWSALRVCVDTARDLGMRLWAYDEYPWASGIAGGRVPAASPDYRMRQLDLLASEVDGPLSLEWPVPPCLVGLSAAPVGSGQTLDGARLEDLQAYVSAGRLRWAVPAGRWRIMAVVERQGLTICGDHFGTRSWTDLTNPEAIDLFIELTHEEYRKRFGEEFGSTIWGMFTDEPPSTFPAWGPKVSARFRELKGYSIEPYLPLLWFDGGPRTAKIRCDYYDTISRLYEEAFFTRCGRWCKESGLHYGGHLLLEENLILNTRFMGHAFRQLRHMDVPGIDWIFPGRIPASVPKLVQSVADCYGHRRVLAETYALAGWSADMQWMRWQMQWEFVNGVNLLVPHAFFYSISDTVLIPEAPDNLGYRWNDCPPSICFRQPYWRHFHQLADLVARTSYLLSQGTHVAQVAVLYPITSVWADFELADGWLRGLHANVYDLPGSWMVPDKLEQGPAAVVTDSCYRAIIDNLREHAVDLDVLDDDTILKAEVSEGRLRVREESFPILVLPAMRTIRRAVLEKAVEFWRQGGTVVALRCLPNASVEEGAGDRVIARLVCELWGEDPQPGKATQPRAHFFSGGFASELEGVMSLIAPNVRISSQGIYVQQRHLPYAEVFYLTSLLDRTVDAEVSLAVHGVPEHWDPCTGKVEPIHTYQRSAEGLTIPLTFEPYDGYFVVVRPGSEPAHIVESSLRRASLHVDEDGITVCGEGLAAGRQFARVMWEGEEIEFEGTVCEGPIEVPLDNTWHFEVLPPPTAPEWHHDMDQLDLMVPPEGFPTVLHTGSWTDQGMPHFSGIGRYRQSFSLDAALLGRLLVLDLGDVAVAARVYLNGELVGDRAWAPYTFPLSGARAGENELVVEVANTLANYIAIRHRDAKERRWAEFSPEQLRSGLIGPVRIVAFPRVELRHKLLATRRQPADR